MLEFSNKNAWILSPRQDMIWFQGSALAGVALLAFFLLAPELNSANYSAVHPAVIMLLLWGVFIDGPHVWATYARSYLAKDAVSREGIPGNLAWGWIFLGPVIAFLDYLWFVPEPSLVGNGGIIFRYFFVFAYLWAMYHLIRQHYGFMVLYSRKSSNKSSNMDKYFLWVGCLYPYFRFSMSADFVNSGLPHPLPVAWFEAGRLALDISFVVLMAGMLIYRLSIRKTHPIVIGPKHLFLAIVITFNMLTFSLLSNLLVIAAVLTIFHDLQYLRIVWQFEQGKKRIPMGGTILKYVVACIVFGAIWYGPRIMGVAVAQTDLIRNILLGLGWGVAFHHYYVDGRIWRVRKTPEIAETLDAGISPASGAVTG